MTTETKTSNIKQWVESAQVTHLEMLKTSGSYFRETHLTRCEKAEKKLEFLIKCMKDNRELLSSHWTSVKVDEHLMNLGEICTAIGLYRIFMGKTLRMAFRWCDTPPWCELGQYDDNLNPAYWWDFMGDQSIRDEGGYVVVFLSPLGVEYINKLYGDIRSLVPHCSYTTK